MHPGTSTAPVQPQVLPSPQSPGKGSSPSPGQWAVLPAPSTPGAGALGTHQQSWGAAPAPSPFTTPSPCWLLPPQWFIRVGVKSPQQCGRHHGGATEGPQEPEPWLLQQGPISSLTKAAMQYWRATGNPKLQYLRAARALLTALHDLQTPLSAPNTGQGSLGQSFARERTKEQ